MLQLSKIGYIFEMWTELVILKTVYSSAIILILQTHAGDFLPNYCPIMRKPAKMGFAVAEVV